ncbi:hypothetical protein SALBM135S_01547 [Streptomyces alboniger]
MSADVDEDRNRLLSEAVALREAGRREEARELLVNLAARFPADEEVAYQTAWVHDTLGLEAEAVPYYERALAGKRSRATIAVGLCSAWAAPTGSWGDTTRQS